MSESSVRLRLKVIPNASKSVVVGWLGEELKVKVTASPEQGKANVAVVKLLAKYLGLSPKTLQIISGTSASHKVVEIHGLDTVALSERLPSK